MKEKLLIKHSRSILLLFILGSISSACTSTEKVVKPSELHNLGKDQGSAVTYDSRGRGAYIFIINDKLKLCAEQFPDASANLASAVAAKIAVDAKADYKDLLNAALGVGADTSQAVTSEIVNVAQRTEAVMVLREALYRLCELHLNEVLDAEQARAAFQYVLSTVRVLGQRDQIGVLAQILVNSNLTMEDRKQLLQTIQFLSLGAVADRVDSPSLEAALSLAAASQSVALIENQRGLLALEVERKAYEQLLSGSVGEAITSFEQVLQLSPNRENINQIIALITTNKDVLLKQKESQRSGQDLQGAEKTKIKNFYQQLLNLSSNAPEPIKTRLRQQAQ